MRRCQLCKRRPVATDEQACCDCNFLIDIAVAVAAILISGVLFIAVFP
jgi:hypothetical protein